MKKHYKVICASCEKIDIKSSISIYGKMCENINFLGNAYFDTEGNYHNHDDGAIVFYGECSLGHSVEISEVNKCWCGWENERAKKLSKGVNYESVSDNK